jgi:hypothetical protein
MCKSFRKWEVLLLLNLIAVGSLSAADEKVISLLDFGALGDGMADDTEAITKAVAYAHANNRNANYTHQIVVPAGVYAHSGLKLNSLRGVRFVGENTSDPVKRKSQFRYVGPPGPAAIEIKSCAFLDFENLYFDLNSVSGVGSLVLFSANRANAEAPLSRWSNNCISFRNCVFMADGNMQGDKPGQTLWIKSASSTIFDKCTFKAAGAAAIKLGADSDADPETGEMTFADGLCSITEIRDSFIAGDIVREKSYNLSLRNNQFAVRSDAPESSRLTTSGGRIALNETIQNCLWDPTGVKNWRGTLIEGGDHPERSGNLRVTNSQLVGRLKLIKINRGSAVIEGNRPVATGGHYGNVFVTIGPDARHVLVRGNMGDRYVALNAPGAIKSNLVVDERSGKQLPFLATDELKANVALSEDTSFVPILDTRHRFEGGRVKISYSLQILHHDAKAATYGARARLGGTVLTATARRVTLSGEEACGILSGSAVVSIPATGDAQNLQLEVNQATATPKPGEVMGGSRLASSSWEVELLDH